MTVFELDRVKREVLSRLSCWPTVHQQTVIACYHNDYSQKREVIVEGKIENVALRDLLPYGIRQQNATYRDKVSMRLFIIFVDRPEDVETADAFACYADGYAEKYLPKGIEPVYVCFKFPVFDYKDFERYVANSKAKYPFITTFYSLKDLRRESVLGEALEARMAQVGDSYKTFTLTQKIYDSEVTMCLTDTGYSESEQVVNFCRNLDRVAEKYLTDATLIVSDCDVDTSPDCNDVSKQPWLLAAALSYLSFKYKLPVLPDELMRYRFRDMYRKFCVSYDAYLAYDKIRYIRDFPKFCYSARSVIESLVYLDPADREFTAKVEYLDGGQVCVTEADMFNTTVYPSVDDEQFDRDLLELESKSLEQKFMHAGNCLYAEIDGERRLVRLMELKPRYSAVIVPSDRALPPIKKELGMKYLRGMIPGSAVSFHKDEGGANMMNIFLRVLRALEKRGSIGAVDFKTGWDANLPAYARDGLGPVITVFTEKLHSQGFYRGLDKRMVDLYGFYNLTMREGLADRLTTVLPLATLRKRKDYLNKWGAGEMLMLSEDMFKTVSED